MLIPRIPTHDVGAADPLHGWVTADTPLYLPKMSALGVELMASTTKGHFMFRTTTTNRLSASAITIAGCLALAGPAHALEAGAFGEALTAFMAKQSLSLSYDSATLDGDDVVLTGLTIGPATPVEVADNDMTFDFGEARFEGVTETDGGGYNVAMIGRENVSGEFTNPEEETGKNETIGYSLGGWGVENMRIPSADGTSGDELAALGLAYDRAFMNDLVVTVDGERTGSIESAESTIAAGQPVTITTSLTGADIDMTTFTEEDLAAWVEGTGYESISGDYESVATWDLASGLLSAETNRLTLDGMGEFNIALAFSGYTPAFVESVSQATSQMQSGDSQAQQAAGMQMLGLMSQLSFGELTLGYRDGGMADTLLEYYAQENGQTKDELVRQTVSVLPVALGQLGVPELQAQITEAVTDFLNDPKSITVSLKPDAPVPAPVLMGAAASSPAQLVDALNATVTSGEAGMME